MSGIFLFICILKKNWGWSEYTNCFEYNTHKETVYNIWLFILFMKILKNHVMEWSTKREHYSIPWNVVRKSIVYRGLESSFFYEKKKCHTTLIHLHMQKRSLFITHSFVLATTKYKNHNIYLLIYSIKHANVMPIAFYWLLVGKYRNIPFWKIL